MGAWRQSSPKGSLKNSEFQSVKSIWQFVEKRTSIRNRTNTHRRDSDMQKRKKPTTDALEIIDRLIYEGKPERLQQLEEVRANDEIGRRIYELRTRARLTQAQLSKLVGTTASVICACVRRALVRSS